MPGWIVGEFQAKLPATAAAPPLNTDEASVWPYVIEEAVGHVTFGFILVTSKKLLCTASRTVVPFGLLTIVIGVVSSVYVPILSSVRSLNLAAPLVDACVMVPFNVPLLLFDSNVTVTGIPFAA